MGLDIYAGPLSRYYSGNWQTVIQKWGAAQGVPVTVVRAGGESFFHRLLSRLMPERAAQNAANGIKAWRAGLVKQGHIPSHSDIDWPEATDLAYESDKPGIDGYGAVQVWTAYAEREEKQRPEEFPDDWSADPALVAVAASPSEFRHIIGPELWLPVTFDSVFEAADPSGRRTKIGSVDTLWREFDKLNRRTWAADESTILQWQKDDFDETNLESVARWGFSIWFALAKFAVERRTPMRLDY